MGFSLSSWLQIRRLYFPNLTTMVKSVQRGKPGGQKSLIHSGGVRDPFSLTQLYIWRAARSALALDNLTSSGPFIPCQSEYNPRVVQSSSQGNETAPLKTSFSGKCYCCLARAFCRFTLIFLWFQGSWEIALNKPKLWKLRCSIFWFWIRQDFWNRFPILTFYILKWSSDTKNWFSVLDTWDGITPGCCFTE